MSTAQQTVLEYVTTALSNMDSDEVDSIDDTTESMQVAVLLKQMYFELVNRQEWSFLKGALAIVSAGDLAAPTKLVLPENCKRLRDLWYNVDTAGGFQRQTIVYLEPMLFLRRFSGGQAAGDRLLVNPGNNMPFYISTVNQPTFYTSFDDKHIWCDAYDSNVESTLQSTKVGAWGDRIPEFDITDAYVPFLPDHMVSLLQHTLNEAAMQVFKQTESPMDSKRVRRQTGQARRAESRLTRKTYFSNRFGRKGGGLNLGSGRRWWDNSNSGGPGE